MGVFFLASLLAQITLAAGLTDDMPVVSTGAFSTTVSSPTTSLYTQGMDLRRTGDIAGAKKLFAQLLEQNPKSGGALEGLTLTSMALGQYEEALSYILSWEKMGHSAYIDSLKATVNAKLHPQPPVVSTGIAVAASTSAAPVSLYSIGMEQRRRGEYEESKLTFLKLLEKDSQSGGALEGLTLTSLALGQNEEALDYAERWEILGDSAYIQSLKARALGKLGRQEELADSLLRSANFNPTDIRIHRRLDDILRANAAGVFPFGSISKTLSQEGLGTRSVNKIIYESRSAGVNGRFALWRGLSAIAGASVSQSAQRNATRGFTYFDVLEQVYTTGLEARGRRGRVWATHGQSLLSDNKAVGVGRVNFSRVQLGGDMSAGDLELRASVERAPYFLRGTDSSRFFALLRENSARVEAEAPRWGVGWLARASLSDYSNRVTVNSQSLTGTRESGSLVLTGSIARGYQEFLGAGPTGKLTIMPFNRAGLRGRLGTDGRWLVSASYDHTAYRDGNRLYDGGADAQLWIPRVHSLGQTWVSYGFNIEEYLTVTDGYRSSDKRSHWLGVFWRRQWRSGPWTQLGYEHGFLNDLRSQHEGNRWTGEVEWHRGRPISLTARARYANTSVGDESASAGFSARWTF